MDQKQVGYCVVLIFAALLNCALGENYVANCEILDTTGDPSQPIEGMITLTQPEDGGDTTIDIDLSGFDASDNDTYHGFHVHTVGNTSEGCTAASGHYNPFNKLHGGPEDTERHVGDLGNVLEDSNGNVKTSLTDRLVKLFGDTSVVDRAIVVHALQDDLGVNKQDPGSTSTGNAGARLGCCVITIVSEPKSSASRLPSSPLVVLVISFILFTFTRS